MDDNNTRPKPREEDLRERRGDRRERGGRKRDRRGRDRDKDRGKRIERPLKEKQDVSSTSSIQPKPPIILTKPMAEKVLQDSQTKDPTGNIQVLAIQRRDDLSHPSPGILSSSMASFSSSKSINLESSSLARSVGSESAIQQDERQEQGHTSSTPVTPVVQTQKIDPILTGMASLQATVQNTMTEPIKIIDESFAWNERAYSSLLEQSDFIVVGVVGMQGVGKSTVLSMIADGRKKQGNKKFLFRPQSKQDVEKSLHKTDGVDLYVTSERLILLDTQPLLSPSILDKFLRHDKKVPSDFGTAETCVEMQSLQILTFLYTVCHVVVVALDHFADYTAMKFLKTAEMLKPSTVAHSVQDGSSSSNTEDLDEYFPQVAFVYNRSARSNFEASHLKSVCQVTDKLFEHSRLKIRGSVSLFGSNLLPCCKLKSFYAYQNLNVFLLPENDEDHKSDKENSKRGYEGHPSFSSLVASLRNQLASMSRQHLTHHPLTEKTWFHYAARTWETVKKSPLLAEYQRLLTA